MKKVFRKIVQWGSLALFLACGTVIMVESAMDGESSGNQSGAVTDQIQDAINKNHDKETIKEIKNFAVTFENPHSDWTYIVGDKLRFSVTFSPSDTSYKELDWSVDDSSILSVNDTDGVISFLKKGETYVHVTNGHKPELSKEFKFTVKNIDVADIVLASTSVTLDVGSSYQLEQFVTVLPDKATNKEVTYTSSNTSVASVSSHGIITAKGAGKTIIDVASSDNPSIVKTFNVTVNKKQEIVTEVERIEYGTTANQWFSKSSVKKSGIAFNVYPRTAKVDINKASATLENNILDGKEILVIAGKYYENGRIIFTVSLSDENIMENSDVQRQTITLKATYGENIKAEAGNLIAFKLNLLNKSNVKSYVSSPLTKFYITLNSKSKSNSITYKEPLSVSLSGPSNMLSYRTDLILWEIKKADGSDYPISTYFGRQSLSTNKTCSLRMTPISETLPEPGIIYFYPNVNKKEEYYSFNFSYEAKEDLTSKIDSIGLKYFKTGKSYNFLPNCDYSYSWLLDTTISVTSNYASTKKALEAAPVTITSSDPDVLKINYDDAGLAKGVTPKKEGTVTIKLSSEFCDDEPEYTFYVESYTNNDGTNYEKTYKFGDENSSITFKDGDTLHIAKDEIKDITVSAKYISRFEGKELIFPSSLISLKTTIESGTKNNIQLVGNTIKGIKQDSKDDVLKLKITPRRSIYDSTLKKTITVEHTPIYVSLIVDYIPVKAGTQISFSYESVANLNQYNSPDSIFSKVPVGSSFKINASIPGDATNKDILVSVSDENIIQYNKDTNTYKALKEGKVNIVFTSADNTSVTKTKTINVYNTTSPFVLNLEKMNPLESSIVYGDDGSIRYYKIALDYGRPYQIYINPLVEASSTTLRYVRSGEEKDKPAVITIDKAGRITTKAVGNTTYVVKYGDAVSNQTYKQTIVFTVKRNAKFTFSELQLLVRKSLGHFGLFAVTAAFACIFISLTFNDMKFKLIAAGVNLITGFSLAGFSELIQLYTPGRFGCWQDVGIDTSGYAATVIICLMIEMVIWIIRRYKTKKKETKEKKED